MKTDKFEQIIETKTSTTNPRYSIQIVQLGSGTFYTRNVILGNNGHNINMAYVGKANSKKGYESLTAIKKHSQYWNGR